MHTSLLALSVLLGAVQAGGGGQNILYSPDDYEFDPLEHLAGIAPYFSPQDPPLSPAPPQGCNVTRAAYLVRHAAIYANDFDYESYIEPFTEKLANTSADFSSSQTLSFLSTWHDPIDEDRDMEQVTKIGTLEAMSLGVELARRYPTFATPKKVWTSTAERTVKSARALISGLDRTSNMSALTQIAEEKTTGANSLTPYKACSAYSSSRGSEQSSVSSPLNLTPKSSPSLLTNVKLGLPEEVHRSHHRPLQGRSPWLQLDRLGHLRHAAALRLRVRHSRHLALLLAVAL